MSGKRKISMPTCWVTRWKYSMAKAPTKPGIWKLESGGYFVRTKHGMRALPTASLVEATAVRRSLEKPVAKNSVPFFNEFAVSLLEERVVRNKIESAATRARWASTLKLYLLPQFHGVRVDEIDVAAFSTELAHRIAKGPNFSATYANDILRVLRTICNVATIRFDLARNPWRGTEYFPVKNTYTPEKPNSLRAETLRSFLSLAKQEYPQHYAMILLGFVTGLRPSSLRALRRHVDVDWSTSLLLIRRSHTRGKEIMEKTKTGYNQAVRLPTVVMDALWEHLQAMPKCPMRTSEYLFPADDGGPLHRGSLDRPFANITKKLKIPYDVTPRAMRRSFQDLARGAKVEGVVTRSISGHRTEEMQEHYSTVYAEEQNDALTTLYGMVTE